jgi:uncharacterized protein (DUF305 family)
MRIRFPLATAVGLAAAIALSGCMAEGMGGPHRTPSGSPTSVAAYNRSDVHFTMMMIPHHDQAIEMSAILLAADGVDSELSGLAERITAAQGPEIEQMTAWLAARGFPDADDMGDMPGAGMLSDDEIDALRSLDGDAAEVAFLTTMIEHHRGAIEMAEAEIAAGRDAEIIALCARIVTSQTAEIAEMETLLAAR